MGFAGPVGLQQPLGSLLLQNAHNVEFAAGLRVDSLRQLSGSGSTEFDGLVEVAGPGGVDLMTASVVVRGWDGDPFSSRHRSTFDVRDQVGVYSAIRTTEGVLLLLSDDDIHLGPQGRFIPRERRFGCTRITTS